MRLVGMLEPTRDCPSPRRRALHTRPADRSPAGRFADERGEPGTLTDRGLKWRLYSELQAARRDRSLTAAADALRGAVALEPGGPSELFGRLGLTPAYSRLAALDILDYAERTLWSDDGQIDIKPRRRLIGEAGKLEAVADHSYDALLASHVLEHLANPLGALAEWQRVVRPGGHILLVVPHRDGTFDHLRPVTTLAHMREDAERQTGEDDATHREEILALHDLELDPGAPSREVFEQRCRDNAETRSMHHHVFVTRTVVDLCRETGLEVLIVRPELPFNILCLSRVPDGRNGEGIGDVELQRILGASPFASDRERAA
ncbi:MAG TPA: methyltransferase domain-containing protein [Solirubrobacteraceae bacterium]|nr:methyltransferase domain-containing protein [Solirubrobacteraceae bacterium]